MSISLPSSKPFKIILLGESGVGKSSIINTFILGETFNAMLPSLGKSTSNKTIFSHSLNKSIQLEVWDTVGHERYRTLTKVFYKDTQAVIFVYDITSLKSFELLKEYWVGNLKENCGRNVVFGLVGNKSDLDCMEEVDEREGRKYAEEIKAIFRLTSNMNVSSIDELFLVIGEMLCNDDDDENKEKMRQRGTTFKIKKEEENKKKEVKKKKCC